MMTDQQRIERLEKVLGILIGWLITELGETNVTELLQLLEEGYFPEAK